ncbi:hypothetical protein HDV05_006245 [Chytridiales sp. JEL 0842]|nr:hypothetical protein HDV05_006245 [Chytridiales sp. JEL 0842]
MNLINTLVVLASLSLTLTDSSPVRSRLAKRAVGERCVASPTSNPCSAGLACFNSFCVPLVSSQGAPCGPLISQPPSVSDPVCDSAFNLTCIITGLVAPGEAVPDLYFEPPLPMPAPGESTIPAEETMKPLTMYSAISEEPPVPTGVYSELVDEVASYLAEQTGSVIQIVKTELAAETIDPSAAIPTMTKSAEEPMRTNLPVSEVGRREGRCHPVTKEAGGFCGGFILGAPVCGPGLVCKKRISAPDMPGRCFPKVEGPAATMA